MITSIMVDENQPFLSAEKWSVIHDLARGILRRGYFLSLMMCCRRLHLQGGNDSNKRGEIYKNSDFTNVGMKR
jgi:hypothetical protein